MWWRVRGDLARQLGRLSVLPPAPAVPAALHHAPHATSPPVPPPPQPASSSSTGTTSRCRPSPPRCPGSLHPTRWALRSAGRGGGPGDTRARRACCSVGPPAPQHSCSARWRWRSVVQLPCCTREAGRQLHTVPAAPGTPRALSRCLPLPRPARSPTPRRCCTLPKSGAWRPASW